MNKKVITFGETMLRLATPDYLHFCQTNQFNTIFGGGEANVTAPPANYGIETELVVRLPQNDIARACVMELCKQGIETSKIICGGERSGTYFPEVRATARASKMAYDRIHSSIAGVRSGMIDWDEAFKDAFWFHWTGTMSTISEGAADVYLEAIQAANRLGITVPCDFNYRENLWKYGKTTRGVIPELVAGCGIIPGNKEDAEKVFGIKPEGFDAAAMEDEVHVASFQSVCTQLMIHFPRTRRIIIILRDSVSANHDTWDGVLYADNRLYEFRRYDIIHIADRAGEGDSFMGGPIYDSLSYPNNDQKALNFAIAVSYLKHIIYGDLNQVTIKGVEKLVSGDTSGYISR